MPIGLLDENPNRSAGHPWYVGENLYGAPSAPTAQEAVDAWAAEAANYDYATNTCSSGTCSHWTQLVWSTTERVGCALSDCEGLTYRYTVVCDYGPGGNTGGRPY